MNLGNHRLLVHLGPGQPGDWYHAQDERTGESGRVLVRWRDNAPSAEWRMAERRLRLIQNLRNDAIVPLTHLVLDHESPHAIWAAPNGVALNDSLKERDSWDRSFILKLGSVVSAALVDAHRLGLVHGQLTAADIYLDGDAIQVDFAIAAALHENGTATVVSVDLPTSNAVPLQMGDPSTDIYSLGSILYRMLHGKDVVRPFELSFLGDSAELQSLESAIESMLASEREQRPTALETRALMTRLLNECSPQTHIRVDVARSTPVVLYPGDESTPVSGKQIGRFSLLKKLGEGGLGVVYLARDQSTEQHVAIKILHRRYTDTPRIVRRFKKEARLLAELQSPYVCRLIEFNEDAGLHYLALEYLQGQSLGKVLERHKMLPESLAVRIVADAARALAEAHGRGMIHRDIKPDNIMLVGAWSRLADNLEGREATVAAGDDIRVKLCDFGMARYIDQSASLDVTVAGLAMGTPLYMAPEQADGDTKVSPRSDVYSLGVTLFHLLAGRPPFLAKTIPALIGMHANEAPPSPLEFNPQLSPAIAQVVLKAMAKAPEARYADATEFLADLERLLRGEPTTLVVHPRLPEYHSSELLTYDWKWELEASPAELWPLISNTERLNQAVGIPAVDFFLQKVDSPGLGGRVDRFGTFRKAGVTNTWREHPYEWVEGSRMAVLRVYSEGVFRWFASIVELHPRAGGGTTLYHRVRIVPRGRFGRLVAALEVGFRGKRAVDAVYRRIDAFLTHLIPRLPETDAFVPQARGTVKDSRTRQRLVDQLAGAGVGLSLAGTLVQFLLQGPQQEVAHIRPIALAHRLQLDPDALIDACLVAAHEGILMLMWDILCPRCRVASSIQETMRAIESHGACAACNLDFELDFANSLELVFRVHPNLRASETGVFCIGGPAHSPHVVAQIRVAAGERLELALPLGEGHYRLQGPQLPYTLDFRAHPEARAIRAEFSLRQGPGADFPRTFRAGAQTLVLTNDHADELVVRIERVAPRADALTAARASSLPRFRELFPQEVLSGNQLVSIARVALLTTALADTAALYELGDARAFGVVHEHFRLLEGHIRKESGTLIKTIREGIVAVFHDPAAAVRVALDLQPLLERNDLTNTLQLRIGVHAGPAMVATLNGKLDYFGATVNLAMTLPEIARAGEIVISQSLSADADVHNLLRARGLSCEVLSDATENLPLYRLTTASPSSVAAQAVHPGIIKLPRKTPAL